MSEPRCRNSNGESQIGVGRCDSDSVCAEALALIWGWRAAERPKRTALELAGGKELRSLDLSFSPICPLALDGILVTFDELAALDRITLELAAGLLDLRRWGRTERGTAFISVWRFFS
jgi:hypothetical protein